MGWFTKWLGRLIAYRYLGVRSLWAYRKDPGQDITAFIYVKNDRVDHLEVTIYRKPAGGGVPHDEPDFRDEEVFHQLIDDGKLFCVI